MRKINTFIKLVLIIGGIVYLIEFFNVFLFRDNQSTISLDFYNLHIDKNLYLSFKLIVAIFYLILGLRIKTKV